MNKPTREQIQKIFEKFTIQPTGEKNIYYILSPNDIEAIADKIVELYERN